MCVCRINGGHGGGGRFMKTDSEAAFGRWLGVCRAQRISRTTLQAEGAAGAGTEKAVV